MRYLHVISSMDPRGGGPAEGVRQLCRAMASDCELEVVSLDAPDVPWAQDDSIPMHLLGPGRLGTYMYSSRLVPWLQANRARFDAVIVHGLWQFHGFATWRALHRSGTPFFVFTHGMLDPWFRRQFPLKHLKKWLYWPWADFRVLRDAAAVLFTCEEERLLARQSFWLYRATERVVSFGTPGPGCEDAREQREHFLTAFPQFRNRRFLLFFGRIHEKKGCDLLVDAFAKVAAEDGDLLLAFAGPDPGNLLPSLFGKLPDEIASRISATGMLTGPAKWGALRCAEAFVLPSHQENFGIAVAEALACGTPVLISDKVNIWREIESGDAGLVAPDTLPCTIDLLQRWIRMDADRRQSLRVNATLVFNTHFHIKPAARKLLDVLADAKPADPAAARQVAAA